MTEPKDDFINFLQREHPNLGVEYNRALDLCDLHRHWDTPREEDELYGPEGALGEPVPIDPDPEDWVCHL